MTGPPLPRLFASLAIGLVLAGAYWLAMSSIPLAMVAEVDHARVMVAGRR